MLDAPIKYTVQGGRASDLRLFGKINVLTGFGSYVGVLIFVKSDWSLWSKGWDGLVWNSEEKKSNLEEQSEEWADGSEEGSCDLGVRVRRRHQRWTAMTEIRRLILPNLGTTTSPSSHACSAPMQKDCFVLGLTTKETLVHIWCFTPVYARRSVPSLSVSREAGVLKWH